MAITGVHVRLLRAAFRMQIRYFANLVGVNKGTVVNLEAGGSAQTRTDQKIRAAFCDVVEFLEEDDEYGPGIRLKKGWERLLQDGDGAETSADGPASGTQAGSLGFTEEERAALLEHYRSRPQAWAAMSDVGREAILQAIGREAL